MAHHTIPFTIRFYEAGPDGRASLPTIANLFQQAAGNHADTLGLSQTQLAAHGLGWVMSRLTWEINRLPHHGEAAQVETWPSSSARGLFHRQYRLSGDDGELLIAASSIWAAFDINARKLGTIPDSLTDKIPFDDQVATAPRPRALPRLADAPYTCPIIPRRTDLDLNGHVNNAQLVGWLLESVPDAGLAALDLLDIQFRRECELGAAVTSETIPIDRETMRHRLIRTVDGADIEMARAETGWRTE